MGELDNVFFFFVDPVRCVLGGEGSVFFCFFLQRKSLIDEAGLSTAKP